MSDKDAGTFDITYGGSAPLAGLFAQMLRDDGVTVEYDAPLESRGVGTDAQAVVIAMVASGSYDVLKATVAKFRERFPRAEIRYEPRHRA